MLLVDRGLVASREQARRLIMAGAVVVNDQRIDKPGTLIAQTSTLRIKDDARSRYVSRGGYKLEAALQAFAVDVGYGQLAWSLRQDPRVVSLERRNIRLLDAAALPETPTLAVIDASFISLTLVIPKVVELIAPNGRIIALVKPQFEVGKGKVGKGGVVRDPTLHAAVTAQLQVQAEQWQLEVKGMVESPLVGAKGNKEFLLYLHKR